MTDVEMAPVQTKPQEEFTNQKQEQYENDLYYKMKKLESDLQML
jgi:hypothetical protein